MDRGVNLNLARSRITRAQTTCHFYCLGSLSLTLIKVCMCSEQPSLKTLGFQRRSFSRGRASLLKGQQMGQSM